MAGASRASALLRPLIVPQTKPAATAAVIFLHGSCDTGQGIRDWVKMVLGADMSFPHIRVVYPTAPLRPYQPHLNQMRTVWHDRRKISMDVSEELDSIDYMCDQVSQLVDDQIKDGIPENRIVIGGFSMGAGMALHLGYRFKTNIAGVFALSGFLNDDSAVYEAIQAHKGQLPPLFQAHGFADPLVRYKWGAHTLKQLKMAGIASEFHTYKKLAHELHPEEMRLVYDWILKRLPEKCDANL